MWEFCVSFDTNSSLASCFKDKIYGFIKSHNGIATTLISPKHSKVLIAVPLALKTKAKIFLAEKISEMIILYYKKDFISSRLNFNITKTLSMQIFLKALYVFDSDTDKQIIIERLNFEKNLVISSFINFRLVFLKNKWSELVSLANDNVMYLMSEDTFGELIRFLISNLEYRCYAVNIFSKKNCYLLCDTSGKVIKDFMVDKHIIYDDNVLLTSLIALNPEKIIIHCNSFVKDKLIKTLYEYFSNRIEICK